MPSLAVARSTIGADDISPNGTLIAVGRAHLGAWRLDEALAAFDEALRRSPRDATAHYLRGETLFLQRRLDEALVSHKAALCHGLDSDMAARGRAMSGLVPGDFGWMSRVLLGDFESAWRLADRDRAGRRQAGVETQSWPRHLRPVWDGSPLAGRRVLVRCWQGLGDAIQFVRYVPLLAGRCAAVSVEAPPELLRLLRPLPGIDRLVPLAADRDWSRAELGCDVEIEAGELPHAFRTRLETIPAAVPYLAPDPAETAAARHRLALLPGLRVGLVWAAGPWKPERSLPFAMLMPLAGVGGVSFVNLQGGAEYQSWRCLAGRPDVDGPVMADPGEAQDIAAMAAVVAALDLVITVDTMAAHLAGALGIPVWLMLHFAADWRWLIGRDDSPWYPTMRLYRQPRPGAWDEVVAAVSEALRRLPPR